MTHNSSSEDDEADMPYGKQVKPFQNVGAKVSMLFDRHRQSHFIQGTKMSPVVVMPGNEDFMIGARKAKKLNELPAWDR